MVARRTVDLLPEIFRTPTNTKFLAATLDQLTQEPEVNRTRGYVGRRIGPGVNPADNYIPERTAQRADYQLEPGVVFLRPDSNQAQDAITYPGMIDSLNLLGSDTQRQDRLFQSEYYTWDSFCDFDKFTNYSQYYWLPEGVNSVDVSSTGVPLTDDYEVSIVNQDGYQFSGYAGRNPTITLARGGTYTFQVSQIGNPFWIQSAPGVNGQVPFSNNISSRDVLGVVNNGDDVGTVTFNVPLKNAQSFFYELNDAGPVDLVTDLKFTDINNRYVDDFLAANPDGIDGITNLDDRTVIFLNRTLDAQSGGWQVTSQFDPLPRINTQNGEVGSYDTTTFDQTTDIVSLDQRYSIWRIQYINGGDGRQFMQLTSVTPVGILSKVNVRFGTTQNNLQYYRNASGFFEVVPLLTAIEDTLWYQDGANPEIFGSIRLIDPGAVQAVDIDDIVGARNYTSPNGVVFTNGLKVQFRGTTNPPQFQDQEYYVEGVGTGPGISARVGFVDGEAYYGPFHVYNGQKMTGTRHTDGFHQFIYNTVSESLLNMGAGAPEGAAPSRESFPMVYEGNGIRLIPVRELVTPETYTLSLTTPYDSTPYDATPYDEALNSPLVPDYITINRSSRDRNAWSRSNRWFHIDVIRYAAERNNVDPVIDNRSRGKRPIIEFRANLGLYNFGTQGKLPVDVIDFGATDALSNINGSTGYSVDGFDFIQGSRVIFAADSDRDVRNRIYTVNFIDPDNDPNSPKIINLVPDVDGRALDRQTVVSLSGLTQQGRSFWFDGANWQLAQQKTSVNQAPLFDVYDSNGRSFGDARFYPSTTFAGNRLFGYAVGGTQRSDEVLGFAVKFLNINNVGDIVFDNYLYKDTFVYVKDSVGTEQAVSTGFVRQYVDRTNYGELIGWLPAAAENRSRQIFRFVNTGGVLILDIPVTNNTVYPATQIFVDGNFVEPSRYDISVQGNNTFITLLFPVSSESIVEARVISDAASSVGFYEVPVNLENNPLNQNSQEFTLGTIRTHYETIGQNLRNINGPIVGANNSRDLGTISRFGQNIIQNSSPLTLAGVFLREPEFEIAQALKFNSQEYEKYKARLIYAASQGDFVNLTPTQVLDAVLQEISLSRDQSSPFYWSDMIPAGETYSEIKVTYSVISTPTFDLSRVYDFSSSNFQSLLVFVNGRILTRGVEYQVNNETPTLTITVPLAVGDHIVIREYPTTFGSFVPNTPTKMGLYPAFIPSIYEDTSYVTPRTVIRGHDGSITSAFGDVRDQVLLEFETRIYNNLKIQSEVPLVAADVIPGQWRQTDYSLSEVNQILSEDFLSWVGWNKLDYTSQTYLSNNAFTYNYSQSTQRVSNQLLLGAWRGIYQYLYDTIAPDTRPWEMLGFGEKPFWWENAYGPAPYTSGNLVLWEDLAQGLVKDPAGEYIIPKYRRPDLLKVIPVDSEGNLLPPLESVVANYDATSFRRSWTFGDGGPTESAWRTSSAWPFAVMRLLSLTKPARFFSLFVDRDRYRYSSTLEQYLWEDRYRLDAKNISPLYGNGVSRASYINWIIDYSRQLGMDSTNRLQSKLSNLDVRLCWRLSAFTDKRFLKIFTERSTPTSLNASLLLPDESYALLLYQNPAFERFQYSSVIIQKVEQGWAVLGYSPVQPYFNILTSRASGLTMPITVGSTTVSVPTQHSDNVVRVPYGYVFHNRAAVCDFLFSYGELLKRQGMTFEGMENGYVMDWMQMCQEFLYWSEQGWVDGSIINLNPAATKISITRPGAVAESLSPSRYDNVILNQNRVAIAPENLVIDRIDNTITLEATAQSSETINFFGMKFTAFEHLVVLDNRSIFADLIYDPITGARQSRVLASGVLSAGWNGTVNAPGFILNQDNISEWSPSRVYTKGEIVRFKDELWAASTIIQPSQEFNYTQWVRSDYNEVQRGLLLNAATSSDSLSNAYNVYSANLEEEADLFSYNLIGFRPRRYMTDLDLDDVSQVNLYQQFLGTKGTRGAAEIFSLADLGKELAEYDIYEYWAVKLAQYGANANRSYFETLLDAPKLTSDPSTIEIVQPGQTSTADQTVLISDIWKSSYRINNTDILPTVTDEVTDRALPTAGYVNFNDVDFAVFDLDNISSDIVDRIGIDSTIWSATDGAYNWNVYRVAKVPGNVIAVTDNLDGTSLVTFNSIHGLSVNDLVIIRFFSDSINGSYRVRSVPSIDTITIDYQFSGRQTTEIGTGIALRLLTTRVAQASNINQLSFSNQLKTGDTVWVDRNSDGTWSVIEKTEPFVQTPSLSVPFAVENSGFGASISQGFFNLSALIGAPGYNPQGLANAPGAVYGFTRSDQDVYEYDTILTLTTADIKGYGNALDIGNQTWAIVGASESNSKQGYAVVVYRNPRSSALEQRLLLTTPDLEFGDVEFGYSVTISLDERWIYIGAPGDGDAQTGGSVYAFGRVDVQEQSVSYVTDGNTFTYSYSDFIKITDSAAWQFIVILGNQLLTPGVDYVTSPNSITLISAPADQDLLIARRNSVPLDQQVYRNVEQSSTSGNGENAQFLVNRVRGVYTVELTAGGVDYEVGDTLTINASEIGGGSSPTNDLTITVTAESNGAITEWTQSGSGVDDTSVFDLSYYLAQVDSIWGFSVTVDGALQRPNQDYEYNNGDLEFITVPPPGAIITVAAESYFEFVEKITAVGLSAGDRFGHSVTTTTDGKDIIVGAPGANSAAGEVYTFSRATESFQVTAAGAAQFTTVQTLVAPVNVSVNGIFLVNTELNVGGEFTVTSSNTVSISKNLQVGDVVTISTNQFTLVQQIVGQQASARLGDKIDQCVNDCSLYISAPTSSTVKIQDGSVELWQNQARLYGSIISQVANPVLTAGDYISINGYLVESTGTTVSALADDINAANVPNVTADVTADLEIIADGNTRTFNVGNIYADSSNPTSPTTVVLANNVVLTAGVDYVYNSAQKTITFTLAPVQNTVITVVSGRLVLGATNPESAPALNKINVRPGIGTLWQDLEFDTYVQQQVITSPIPQDFAKFGQSLFISNDTVSLVVGAPGGSIVKATTFDRNRTDFDAASTSFSDTTVQSGAVYTYDFLPAYQPSVENPGQFVFGQEITPTGVQSLDQFGAAVDLTTGILLTGAPGNDLGDSQLNFGTVFQAANITNGPAWIIKRQQTPSVNVNALNTCYIYDYTSSAAADYLDFFDPLQGRLLGTVAQNIDYIGAVDPASYNIGPVNNRGSRWAQEFVGKVWWDTSQVRFIDPNQGDLAYASSNWGQVFPGSQVQVYQWISSDVAPAAYTGPGTPRSVESFVIVPTINEQGIFSDVYYFWVIGIDAVDAAIGKTLSTVNIARYIENPQSSGVPYLAPLGTNAVALYNCESFIAQGNTVLHVEFDKILNDAAVHVEYQLIAQGRPEAFLNNQLYRKLLDSFCGADTTGALVPDPFLSPSERYGVAIRPRQSMFVNRFAALQNYLESANTVLAQFPISEIRSFRLLNSEEPQPTAASQQWAMKVANDQELSFQNLLEVPIGYRYLVESDATNRGLWSIYQVISGVIPGSRELQLLRVQNYDTKLYWERINWYQPGFDPLTRVLLEVPVFSSLAALTVPVNSVVKVTSNARGKWELYRLDASGWTRVGLQDGTIRFKDVLWNYRLGRYGFDVEVFDSQYFDQEPVIETRKIIEALNQELLIDDLLIERHNLLILMFNYILSEQLSPDWLTKTSLIDVDHTIRDLQPFQIYRQDNQDFVLEYIKEVKPYHTQIREFGLIYRGQDTYLGSMTDFDVPAYWSASENRFISPVLDNTGTLSTTSSTPSDDPIWQTFPWNQWYQNYLLNIESVTVVDGGSGYTVPPQVEIIGNSQRPAVMTARINSAGRVVSVDIVDAGEGYSARPEILLVGGNGIGARATAVVGNPLVRSINTTIKYDRYEYQSRILPWQSGQIYLNGDRVRYSDRVWQAVTTNSNGFSSQSFDTDQWVVVPASELSGVDRTMGYYAPTADQPGLDLAQLISGVDYPGVQVKAPDFNQDTGFDVGNFDINPFDNISFGEEGQPTYDPAILDTIYQSNFTDPYLGTLPAPAYGGNPPNTGPNPIVISGGEFVDTYSSHAPEELVPGAIFDTLDIRVYSTPGSDWDDDGHGFPAASLNFEFVAEVPFAQLFEILRRSLFLVNTRTQQELFFNVDYTIDFANRTITFSPLSVQIGDFIQTTVFAINTTNVIFFGVFPYPGPATPLPAPPQLIDQVVSFVNATGVSTRSFADLIDYPVTLQVWNVTTQRLLFEGIDYIIDWPNKTVTVFTANTSINDIIQVTAYGLGGGNQLFIQSYNGSTLNNGLIIPRQTSLIHDIVVFVNGQQITDFAYTANGGFSTTVDFDTVFTNTDYVTVTVFGFTDQLPTPSWSSPVTQLIVSDGSPNYTLTNSLSGTNPVDLVVTVNGQRARPNNNLVYTADGVESTFEIPVASDVLFVANNDVSVYVDNQPLTLNVQFFIDPWDGSSARTVTLAQVPALGARVLVSVRTNAQYRINGNTITFVPGAGLLPAAGSIIGVTTFNDTSQQDIFTRVYVGPETQGLQLSQGYDITAFDIGDVSGEPGSFDYGVGTVIQVNRFDIGRPIENTDRLLVSRDGRILFNNIDYEVDGQSVVLLGAPINSNSVVAITSLTNSVLPGPVAFRVFQDMRGIQTLYRITEDSTTTLTQSLSAVADVIHVQDASKLGEPNLAQGIFGLITINGERIAYRNRNVQNNTVSGLRRGTAGTGAADHAVGTAVISINANNRLPAEYQRRVIQQNFLGNGVQDEFTADEITLSDLDSTELVEAVQVFVGGSLQNTGYTVESANPVRVQFAQAPTSGYQVSVRIQQAQVLYQQGLNTASNGVALQETDTAAARFIRDK